MALEVTVSWGDDEVYVTISARASGVSVLEPAGELRFSHFYSAPSRGSRMALDNGSIAGDTLVARPPLCCDEAEDPFGDRDEASLEHSLLGSPPQAERQRLWQRLVELASHNAEAEELLERISSQNGAVQSKCERVLADEAKQGCMSIQLLELLQVACGSLFPPVGKCRTVSTQRYVGTPGTPGFWPPCQGSSRRTRRTDPPVRLDSGVPGVPTPGTPGFRRTGQNSGVPPGTPGFPGIPGHLARIQAYQAYRRTAG